MVSLEEINWLSLVFMVVAIPISFGSTWMLDTLGLRITVRSSLITEASPAAHFDSIVGPDADRWAGSNL